MLARQTVLLTEHAAKHAHPERASGVEGSLLAASRPSQLLSRQQAAPVSLLAATLNTYGSPRKCCKQKTYSLAKPFRCNTYKKLGGHPSSQKFLPSTPFLLFGRSNVSTCKRFNVFPVYLPSSVPSSKFRILHPLCLALLRKLPGCGGILPILELSRPPSFPPRITDHKSPYFLSSLSTVDCQLSPL